MSRTCRQAVQAMACLASGKPGVYVRSQQVSRCTGLPGPGLAKVLRLLASRGLIESAKGRRGGFCLPRGRRVSLRDIVEGVDGLERFTTCSVGLGKCDDRQPCPLHGPWKRVVRSMNLMLSQTRLGDLRVQLNRQPTRGCRPRGCSAAPGGSDPPRRAHRKPGAAITR